MKFLHNILIAMGFLINFIKVFGGIALHLYTVYLFFLVYGILGGIISLFMPVFSQIFMAYKLIVNFGWNTLYPMILKVMY